MAHRRRLSNDDGVSAAEAADFIVTLVINGLRLHGNGRVPNA
jgi:hypothetical protein